MQTNPQYIELHICMPYFIILSSVELHTRMRSNPLTLPSVETGLSSASVILKSYIASTRQWIKWCYLPIDCIHVTIYYR